MRQEIGVLGLEDQVVGPDLGREIDLRAHRGDVGLDVGRVKLPGDRHPVVAVAHEVGLADLVDLDRRHAAHVADGGHDPGPPLAAAIPPGQEAAGEVVVATDAADDGVQGDIGQPLRRGLRGPELAAHLLVGEEVGRPAGQAGHDLLQRGPAARAPEVLHG